MPAEGCVVVSLLRSIISSVSIGRRHGAQRRARIISARVSGRCQNHRFPGHMVATMLIFTLSHRHDRKPPRACQSLEFSDADRENAPCLSLFCMGMAQAYDQHAVEASSSDRTLRACFRSDSGRCIQTALSRIRRNCGFNASRFVSAGKQSSSQSICS